MLKLLFVLLFAVNLFGADYADLAQKLTADLKSYGVKSLDIEQDPMSMSPRFLLTIHFQDGKQKKISVFVNFGQEMESVLLAHLEGALRTPSVAGRPAFVKPIPLNQRLKTKFVERSRQYELTPISQRRSDLDSQAFADFAYLVGEHFQVKCAVVKIESAEWSGDMSTVGEPKDVTFSVEQNGVSTVFTLHYEVELRMAQLASAAYLNEAYQKLSGEADRKFNKERSVFFPIIPAYFQ